MKSDCWTLTSCLSCVPLRCINTGGFTFCAHWRKCYEPQAQMSWKDLFLLFYSFCLYAPSVFHPSLCLSFSSSHYCEKTLLHCLPASVSVKLALKPEALRSCLLCHSSGPFRLEEINSYGFCVHIKPLLVVKKTKLSKVRRGQKFSEVFFVQNSRWEQE